MKELFKSEDGKIFENKSECIAYEEVIKSNETFKKSRFFSVYGSELEKYDTFAHVIYIDPDEFSKMQAYLRTQMRDIKGLSESNVYYLYCMTFYPIERQIEKEKEQIKRAEKNIKELEKIQKRIHEVVKV